MGYPDIVAGNDETRSRDDRDATLLPVLPVARQGALGRPIAVGFVLVVAIATLVAKPWAWLGSATPARAPDTAIARPVATASVTPPTPSAGTSDEPSPDLILGPAAPLASTASPPPGAYIENLAPIEPDRWTHLSASLASANADGVVFVARYPAGLYYSFQRVTPSDTPRAAPPSPDGTTNTVRVTGYLANPVAIGLTRPAHTDAPLALAWQVIGPGRLFRLTLRHPVGDLDRYLFLGPGLGLPPGERRNRREISRWPPTWQAGVYRFDLATDGGTRYLFVVLEP